MLWHSYRGAGAALLFQRVPPFRAASISMLGPQSPELCARPVFRNFLRGVQKIEGRVTWWPGPSRFQCQATARRYVSCDAG
jgi:hypothetical protein